MKKSIFYYSISLLIFVYLPLVILDVLTDRTFPEVDIIANRLQKAKAAGVTYDTRSIPEFLKDSEKEGRVMVPAHMVGQLITNPEFETKYGSFFPLAGIGSTPTVYCNENGQYVTYVSDRFGFHNFGNVENDHGILLLGDSFTQGGCVPSERNLAGWLSNRKLNVVNLGLSSSGPLIELAVLKEYGVLFKPKIVFWIYFEGNDLTDLQIEWTRPSLRKYLEVENFSQHLKDRQPEIDEFWKKHWQEISQNHPPLKLKETTWGEKLKHHVNLDSLKNKYHVLKDYMALKAGVQKKEIQVENIYVRNLNYTEALSRFKLVMTAAQAAVVPFASKIIFVYLPSYERYALNLSDHKAELRDMIENLGIPFLDMTEKNKYTV